MLNQNDWLIHLDHYKDLLREAEQERLARFAISARTVKKVAKKMEICKDAHLGEAPEIACCMA